MTETDNKYISPNDLMTNHESLSKPKEHQPAPLKHCPFCGKDNAGLNHDKEMDAYEVVCPACGGRTGFWSKPTGAEDSWNKRTPP